MVGEGNFRRSAVGEVADPYLRPTRTCPAEAGCSPLFIKEGERRAALRKGFLTPRHEEPSPSQLQSRHKPVPGTAKKSLIPISMRRRARYVPTQVPVMMPRRLARPSDSGAQHSKERLNPHGGIQGIRTACRLAGAGGAGEGRSRRTSWARGRKDGSFPPLRSLNTKQG